MKINFQTGTDEKHNVEFYHNRFWGNTLIKVDGKNINGGFELFMSKNKEYKIVVGEKEKHSIRFTRSRPALFPGFKPFKYQVYIDEVLFKEAEGF